MANGVIASGISSNLQRRIQLEYRLLDKEMDIDMLEA